MALANKLYYLKILLGFIVGIVCGALKLEGLRGIFVGILGYVALYIFLKRKGIEQKEIFTGIAEYIGSWVTSWTIVYSIL